MIIHQLACERFAGVQDVSVELKSGMNILLGSNESGKSTMADLLYHLFFRDIKLGKKEVEDKSFTDTYFPKGVEADGDIIDGTVRFETEKGVYRLSKEWSLTDSSCRLTLPDGTRIRSESEIKKHLEEVLHYGRGIYDELIFPSQKRRQALLTALLESQPDKKKDAPEIRLIQTLTATVNKAVLETGGISIDTLESKLRERLNAYAFRWDEAAEMPEGGKKRGLQNRWKNPGRILSAYYDMEAAAQLLKETEEAERAMEVLSRQIRETRQKKKDTEEEKDRFAQVQGALANHENIRKLRDNALHQAKEMQEHAGKWPEAKQRKESAEQLKQQLEDATLYGLYQAVAELKEQLRAQQEALDGLGRVSDRELQEAQRCSAAIQRAEARIHGLNLTARLKLLGDTEVTVTSAATDQRIDIGDGSFPITEAVEITAPGILQLQLMPQGVDLDALRGELAENRAHLDTVFRKYHVESLGQLQKNAAEADRIARQLDALKDRIALKLNGLEWEALAEKAARIGPPPEAEETIRRKLHTLCGCSSPDNFIGQQEILLRDYCSRYETPEKLAEQISALLELAQKYDRKLADTEDIPEEYRNVTDTDTYLQSLKTAVERWDEVLVTLEDRLRATQLPGDANSAEECREKHQLLAEAFEAEKAQYCRWKHIHQIFLQLKEQEKEDPAEDISARFRVYLSLLSGEAIRLKAMDERLQSSLVSGKNRLTYGILSEGTKDTISLAFRLAMLEHLYPEGGAVALFDDPFTDMDPHRTAQACRLLQRFAEHNQVLFITCDEKYLTLLSGNTISMPGHS